MLKGKSDKIKIPKSQRDLLAHLGPITLKNLWSIFFRVIGPKCANKSGCDFEILIVSLLPFIVPPY